MADTAVGRWAVRIVVGMGIYLAVHSLVIALVTTTAAGSMRPWSLSLDLSFLDSERSAADGVHNFGASQVPETPPPGSPWYAPRVSDLNNLTVALSSSTTGIYGFYFNGSTTPDGAYGTYNWCNMPHVRAAEYVVPSADQKRTLVYVELVHRHHKRTPYASNGFPHEPYQWECDDARIHLYSDPVHSRDKRPGVVYYVPTFEAPSNPFLAAAPAWHGSCQFPQLTSGGLEDAWLHGADLYGVYHDLLGFLPAMNDAAAWSEQVAVRVTNNPITSQTVAMVLGGMAAAAGGLPVPDTPLSVEAVGFDSLEPQYTCPAAAELFSAITSESAQGGSPAWADHLERLQPLFAKLDAASGIDPADPRGFHTSVDHYFDNLSARQCHGKPPVEGIPQDVADTVFRVGQWEYSRMYRDDARSLAASAGAWGVWVAQLARHLRAAATPSPDSEHGKDRVRYRHNVAHDGSVSRLLSILQADEMVWPGMGSEVVVELWKKETETTHEGSSSSYDVRVLFGGKVLRSSHPELGLLDMVPLDALLTYIDGLVGSNASLLPAKCNGTSPL
ncbi:acid phosphatase [Sporothrix brasiliensis 5110]|uniref:Acid phosphatase n=1 Tax=Sporothrix brasiliensis 5110 TaxID=1398154 RepID=A0A0C2IH31_9PEZI|nr:acid phosphatase [Sporothrix brasiliensis 5110]KIH86330.1 acid phosphatase [Sporothrix brasiliensis 5110]